MEENIQQEICDELFEEYIQELRHGFPSIRPNNPESDFRRYRNFIESKNKYFEKYPGLESCLISRIRKQIFEVIDEWLEYNFITHQEHENFNKVFKRTIDGKRKSKKRKSKKRKSKKRKSKKSKNIFNLQFL
jgi:hypothetical protein